MTHMQRSGWVGGDELHHGTLSLPESAAAVALAQLMNGRELPRISVRRQKKLMKPAPATSVRATRGLAGSAATIALRQLTGITPRGLGEAQGYVRGEVAILSVARALHDDRVGRRGFGEQASRKVVQGGQHELLELLLQGVKFRRWKAPEFTRDGRFSNDDFAPLPAGLQSNARRSSAHRPCAVSSPRASRARESPCEDFSPPARSRPLAQWPQPSPRAAAPCPP